MRSKTANPDKNRGMKLVIPVKTRSPIEAMQMLRAGQPIDQAAGYYSRSGVLEKDFYMMDNIDKLHALAGYRELVLKHQSDVERLTNEAKEQISAAKAARAAKEVTNKTDNNEK